MKFTWWRHQMETFSALLVFVRGLHRSPVDSTHKGQWRGALMFSWVWPEQTVEQTLETLWWLETPSRSLWRHCNDSQASCAKWHPFVQTQCANTYLWSHGSSLTHTSLKKIMILLLQQNKKRFLFILTYPNIVSTWWNVIAVMFLWRGANSW